VVESCDESISIAEDLLALAERWEQELHSYRAHSATRRLPRFLIGHPVLSVQQAAAGLSISVPAANAALNNLLAAGIVSLVNERQWGRVFQATQVLRRLDQLPRLVAGNVGYQFGHLLSPLVRLRATRLNYNETETRVRRLTAGDNVASSINASRYRPWGWRASDFRRPCQPEFLHKRTRYAACVAAAQCRMLTSNGRRGGGSTVETPTPYPGDGLTPRHHAVRFVMLMQ
jgi:hypothetical protein